MKQPIVRAISCIALSCGTAEIAQLSVASVSGARPGGRHCACASNL